jgi:tetratricopeptide (TPR) repeat protein
MLDVYYFDKTEDNEDMFVGASSKGQMRLGGKFYKDNEFTAAELYYEQALNEEPDNPILLNKLARTCIAQNKYEKAEEKLKHSIDINPNYVTSYALLGDVCYELGEMPKAKDAYEVSLAINPFNYSVYKRLAIIAIEQKQFDAAENALSSYLILLQNDPEAEQMLMEVRRERKIRVLP